MNKSLYGNYRTRTFADIFEPAPQERSEGKTSVDIFIEYYTSIGIPTTIRYQDGTQVNSAKTLFYLLYGAYGNSSITSSDEEQWLYKLFSIVFMYGPSWEKRLEIQAKVRNLTEAELTQGSKVIYNHAYNPGQEPSTDTLEEILAINEQNATNNKRSKIDAYAMQFELITTDVTKEFLNKFKDLFLKIVEPQLPLWYVTEEGEEE